MIICKLVSYLLITSTSLEIYRNLIVEATNREREFPLIISLIPQLESWAPFQHGSKNNKQLRIITIQQICLDEYETSRNMWNRLFLPCHSFLHPVTPIHFLPLTHTHTDGNCSDSKRWKIFSFNNRFHFAVFAFQIDLSGRNENSTATPFSFSFGKFMIRESCYVTLI